MYDELLDDPKVQRLSPQDFKGWVNLLCLASKNGGKLPAIDDIAFALRETPDAVSTLVERLRSGGLIERRSGGADGAYDALYKWNERQYKSDTSTERVKRFRKRSGNAKETPPEADTETEGSVDKSTGPAPDPLKEMFDVGVSILTAAGHTEKEARSLIGKWRKGRSPGEVVVALIDCRTKAISNPVEWLTKRFAGSRYVSESGYEYRGDLEAIKREAQKRADWTTYHLVERDMRDAA
jgi:predicted transcriptional regulator